MLKSLSKKSHFYRNGSVFRLVWKTLKSRLFESENWRAQIRKWTRKYGNLKCSHILLHREARCLYELKRFIHNLLRCNNPIFICLILCWVLKSLHRYLFGVLSVQLVQCYIIVDCKLLEDFNSSILWRFWRFFKIKCSFILTFYFYNF